MTDDGNVKRNDPRTAPDLRTIIARLGDLQRKCRSAGSRNQDAMDMEARLASVLERLQGGDDPDGEPIPFAGLARELFPVARFFESNGFLSISREVAHVERALEALATPDEVEATTFGVDPPSALQPEAATEAARGADDEEQETSSRWVVPGPVAAVTVVFVVAVTACIVVIVRHLGTPTVAVESAPTPLATMAKALEPTAIPTPRPTTPATAKSPGARLAEAVSKARLALVEGDVEAAIDHVSTAALIDADHATVLAAAHQIVELLVARSDDEASGGDWTAADLSLARARRIAERFGLESGSIDDATRRHAEMKRFRLLRPGDGDAIRAAAGRRVTIHLRDGTTRESVIRGVEGGDLLLDEDTAVRGGTVYFVERVPLAAIDRLQVWED